MFQMAWCVMGQGCGGRCNGNEAEGSSSNKFRAKEGIKQLMMDECALS